VSLKLCWAILHIWYHHNYLPFYDLPPLPPPPPEPPPRDLGAIIITLYPMQGIIFIHIYCIWYIQGNYNNIKCRILLSTTSRTLVFKVKHHTNMIYIEKDTSSPNLGLSILMDRKAAIVGNLFNKSAIYFTSLSKALSIVKK